MRRPRSAPGKAARNERRKLRATTLNAIALAVVAVGVIQPAFASLFPLRVIVRMVLSSVVAYVCHSGAVRLVLGLED